MQNSRINYVIVGGFVAAMLVLFIMVVSMLAGRTGATDNYYTVYDNVGGLKFGTLVLYEGYQIGQVESIEPMFKGQSVSFRVNFSVQEGWKIPEDSVARATVSGLLSALAIDIDGGDSPTSLKPGALVKGASPSNFFASLSQIGSEFGDLSATGIKPLLESLKDYVKNLDKMTMDNVPATLANLQKLSNDMARDVPAITSSLKRTTGMIENDVLKPENLQHIDSIIANLDGLAADLGETRTLLNASMKSVNKVIEDNAGNVDESLRNLRYTLDTIARYVDDIAHNAEATTRNMAEFSRAIRENPGLLVSGSPQPDQVKTSGK